jgi:hypothetical protein
MDSLLAKGLSKNSSRLLSLGLGAGALLAVAALSPTKALALPMGPLDKSNNDSTPQLSNQESRLGISNKYKSNKNSSLTDSGLSERPLFTGPVQGQTEVPPQK